MSLIIRSQSEEWKGKSNYNSNVYYACQNWNGIDEMQFIRLGKVTRITYFGRRAQTDWNGTNFPPERNRIWHRQVHIRKTAQHSTYRMLPNDTKRWGTHTEKKTKFNTYFRWKAPPVVQQITVACSTKYTTHHITGTIPCCCQHERRCRLQLNSEHTAIFVRLSFLLCFPCARRLCETFDVLTNEMTHVSIIIESKKNIKYMPFVEAQWRQRWHISYAARQEGRNR